MFANAIRKAVHPATWAVFGLKKASGKKSKGQVVSHRGTAFAVDTEGHLLTCWHVTFMDDDQKVKPDVIKVAQPEIDASKMLDATVVCRDKDTDLAVLKIDSSTSPVSLNGAKDQVPWGTGCAAFGHPLSVAHAGGFRIYTRAFAGVLSMPYTNPRFPGCPPIRLYETDFFAHGGLSGGPLFTPNGCVFGVISGSLLLNDGSSRKATRSNLSVAIDIAEAIELLHQLGIKPKFGRHIGGTGIAEKLKHWFLPLF